MPLASTLKLLQGKLASAFPSGSLTFSPTSLFASNEPGVWYDASDTTTLFEDSTGYTPVHVPGNGVADSPVGLFLDKHSNGVGSNGAYRYNLLQYTEQLDNGYWTKARASITTNSTTAPDGTTTADTLIESTATDSHVVYESSTNLTASSNYRISVYCKAKERTWVYVSTFGGTGWGASVDGGMYVNLSTGTVGTIVGTTVSYSITNAGNGWWLISLVKTCSGTGTGAGVMIGPALGDNQFSYTGNGTSGIYLWGTQLSLASAPATYQKITSDWVATIPGNHATQSTSGSRPTLSARYNVLTATSSLSTQSVTTVAATYLLTFSGTGTITLSGTKTGTYSSGSNTLTGVTAGTLTLTVSGTVTNADLRLSNDGVGLPSYQSVTNANTYDSVGFPYYLKFDGVDDAMSSSTVALSPTKQITAWLVMRQLAQPAFCDYFEGDWHSSSTGRFQFINNSADGAISVLSSGGTIVKITSGALLTPSSQIASVSSDMNAPLLALRLNGVDSVSSTSSQGAGTFANQPIYLGSDIAFPPNMRLYGAILRGTASTPTQISNTETWLNSIAKFY